MDEQVGAAYLDDVVRLLRQYKALADRAVAQIEPSDIFRPLDGEANSIAVLFKHMAGNMRSRWTDFLTTDGEKPDRNRDAEFELGPGADLADLRRIWEDGWRLTLSAIEALGPGDLLREVRIRDQPHTVLQAIQRQVTHYAYHVGQIVMLAKHARGAAWETLSMPKRRTV
ncbi:MAG TPA: DUF1572 family protein [Gemmatimonadales bacterium]|jgi:hypothetical protein|nr:DUF1572 family protein [Gemmatimonadales bacterium]